MKAKKEYVSRISLPCAVTLLSTGAGNKRDVMTATAMFISEEPPLIVVSVGKNTLCHELIERTGEFVLNVAATDQVKLAKALGATHGAKTDKLKKFQMRLHEAESVASPLIEGSFSHIECKVITSFPVSNYVLYLAGVSAKKVRGDKVPVVWYAQRYFSLNKEVR